MGTLPIANQPLERLLGAENEETLALIREAFRSEEGNAFYHVPLAIAGDDTVNNVRTLPIYDEERLIGNIIIIEDITEFDKLQKQVILSEKLASVGLLAAGVAHEINNPLEIVYNYLKYIKYSFDDAKLHETVDELHEEITYIAGIVRDLLSLSGTAQVQTGRDRHQRDDQEHDGPASPQRAREAHHHGIRLAGKGADPYGQPQRDQAGDPQPREEQLRGHAGRRADQHRNLAGAGRTGTTVRFDRVQRHGPGIPDANLTNVFIPFYSTRKGKGDHVGLGLSICYGIIKRHDGSMSVRNLERAGCRFTIRLPLP